MNDRVHAMMRRTASSLPHAFAASPLSPLGFRSSFGPCFSVAGFSPSMRRRTWRSEYFRCFSQNSVQVLQPMMVPPLSSWLRLKNRLRSSTQSGRSSLSRLPTASYRRLNSEARTSSSIARSEPDILSGSALVIALVVRLLSLRLFGRFVNGISLVRRSTACACASGLLPLRRMR